MACTTAGSASYINVGGGIELVDNSTCSIRTLSAVGSVALLSSANIITLSGGYTGGATNYTNIGGGAQLIDNNTSSIRTISATGSLIVLSGTDVLTLSAGSSTSTSSIPDMRFIWLFN